MSPEEALEQVNATTHVAYSLNAEYSGGEDQGAFRVTTVDGTSRAVLKLNRNPQWINQVQRAKAATNHLAKMSYPVPVYMVIGSTDRGTYSLQSELPGSSATPTPAIIADLMKYIELQKGQTISEVQGQDWVWYLMDVVFRGESGNVRALMQFSGETSALVTDIENLVVGLQGKVLPKTDLVHGDMAIGQVLASGEAVTGVVDWDQVGYGDRTQDYVSLWYSLLSEAQSRDMVMEKMLQVSDPEAIKIHAVYKMLTDVAWHINKSGGDVAGAVARARTATELLKAIKPAEPAPQ